MKLLRLVLLSLLLGTTAYAQLTTNLISCWDLGEASGTRADSVIASGNDLTDNNTVTQAVGKVGNAAQFTQSNTEFLSRASNATLVTGDIDFTVAAWVYADSTATQSGLVSKTDQATWEYELYHSSLGVPGFYVENAGTNNSVLASVSLTLSTWYFVVAWHDATANTISISVNDGTPVAAALSGGARTSVHAFNIGGENGGNTFDGRIDQVVFSKKVWSAADITAAYNGGAGLSCSALQGAVTTSPLRRRRN